MDNSMKTAIAQGIVLTCLFFLLSYMAMTAYNINERVKEVAAIVLTVDAGLKQSIKECSTESMKGLKGAFDKWKDNKEEDE